MRLLILALCVALTGCATGAPPAGIHVSKFEYDARMPERVGLPGKVIVVFIDQQYFVAYERGEVAQRQGRHLHGYIATGTSHKPTPITNWYKGPHRIEYKEEQYVSKTYPEPTGGAPMPYAMFFNRTEGFALHGGDTYRPKAFRGMPYGMSHGCVRLPLELAKILFEDFSDETVHVIVTWNPKSLREHWETRIAQR